MEITLSQWLESHGLLKYHEVLLGNDLDTIKLVKELTVEDLKELGVSLGDRKRFSLAIEQLISQSSDLSPEDLSLIDALPYVIAYPLRRTLLERHAWTKINLLKDSFLNYLKYLGLLTASEFFNSPIKDKKMVALFQQALAEPSFGSWNQYIRETLQFLQQQDHSFFCEDLLHYYISVESGKKRKLYKVEIQYFDGNGDIQSKKQEATGIGMLINFRNRHLGHGLTLNEKDSKARWDEYYPIFKELLEQLSFAKKYPMFKHEHGETFLLQSSELHSTEKGKQTPTRVWIENAVGDSMDILPFFVVPGELSIASEDKEQILTYESYTGKTIKFFSPEGTEKHTSGKILERLNLLLRDKQKEEAYSPEQFTKEVFLSRIAAENKLIIDSLVAERKVIPGIYVHREEMEIKLREWIGTRASIFFIAAEAGSGKTNLLVEMQKQYVSRNLPCLLIRAARMEKQSLKEQLCYLLNMDGSQGLQRYAALAGSQDAPTFIMFDGLNEASQPEALWQELLEISKCFPDGCLKFVVTVRANGYAEVDRYPLSDSDNLLTYGNRKDGEQGLRASTHWLTPLNMKEMKAAWEDYVQSHRNRFNPQFDFDLLATFDRGLYGQICNPLVLRLFLETYNGKPLPKNKKGHLNIWQDWLMDFSIDEQLFLTLLADTIWEKGENELMLDELLKDEKLQHFFTTDQISAPYPRLKNKGWISRYTKDLNAFVSFTVEGALLFLIGRQLAKEPAGMNLQRIQSLLRDKNQLKISALESFLCQKSLSGDLTIITDLIDAGNENIQVCIGPLLLHLKSFGAKTTLEKILQHPSENDWKVLYQLDKKLSELQLVIIRKEYLTELMLLNTFQTKESILLALEACLLLERNLAESFWEKISLNIDLTAADQIFLTGFGNVNENFGYYDKALFFYEKCLDILLKNLTVEHPDVAMSYNNIGVAWFNKGDFNQALDFYQKALKIRLKTLGTDHADVASSYNNIGSTWNNKGDYDKALGFYQKCLEILLKILGMEHPYVATTYNNIGYTWDCKGDYDQALTFYKKSLKIRLKTLGSEHPHVATSYNNIGYAWDSKGDYNQALEFYQKSLDIRLITFGSEHPEVAKSYNDMGVSWYNKGDFNLALDFYQKCLDIRLKALESEHPDLATTFNNIGLAYINKGDYNQAIVYIEKCLNILLKTLGTDHPYVATSYNNIGLAWDNRGDHYQALEFYQKCLDIRIKTLGSEHLDIASSFYDIGSTWENIGDKEEAMICFLKSAEIRKDHPDLAQNAEPAQASIKKVKDLAMELGKIDELPDWMISI
jgi:tetratricopeptide (TPR) repeat protein